MKRKIYLNAIHSSLVIEQKKRMTNKNVMFMKKLWEIVAGSEFISSNKPTGMIKRKNQFKHLRSSIVQTPRH